MNYRLFAPLSQLLISFVIADDAPHVVENSNQKLFTPYALKDDCHFALTTDVLFWQANQDGLQFVIENKGSTTTLNKGHVKEPDFNWNWGFRVGLDYKMAHDQWDLMTRYTYFHASALEHGAAPDGGALFPIWQASSSGFATHAKAKWFCNLNRTDLELGRNCMVSKWLSIRPFMGLTGAVIQQRYHLEYRGGTAVPAGDRDRVKMSHNFWGVGLRFGFNSLWGLGKGFSIYADGAGSLLSGNFHVHQKEHLQVNDITLATTRDHQSSVVPILEIALGLQWDHMWHNDRYHFGTKLGWEFNQYFNQNRYIRFLSTTNPGAFIQNNDDLSFMGVTLGFRLDF